MKFQLILLFLFPFSLSSQTLTQNQAELFIQFLISDNDSIYNFTADEKLQISNSLGIHYENVDCKFLISSDIDADLKEKINNKKLTYTVTVHQLAEKFSRLEFSIKSINYDKIYFFQEQKLISPVSYYSRNWKCIDSKYFKFFISDPSLFNSYCTRNLDVFFLKMAERLKLSRQQIKKIQTQKIFFYLCKDPEEIKKIPGYNTIPVECIILLMVLSLQHLTHITMN